MAFWHRWKVARDVATKSTFTQLPVWNLDHPLNLWWSPANGGSSKEAIENDFEAYVMGAYKANGPVFSCMQARSMVFSEARFMYRRLEKGRPSGDLWSDENLDLLENPWPGGTTGELLSRMLQDADLAGNSYWTKADDSGRLGNSAVGPGVRLVRMRPDWVTMIIGTKQEGEKASLNALDARVLLYRYRDPTNSSYVVDLLPEEVVHFSPIPDPIAKFRGMSWLTPVLREIEADKLAVVHKKRFLDDAAVPNIAIKFDKDTAEDDFQQFVSQFKAEHQGAFNAYKTLFLSGGADITPLSFDFRQLEFNQSIGKGESRIASAAGVPSSWVGFSEGLTGSGLNSQGVFAAARRRFADGTIKPLLRMAAEALAVVVLVPGGNELWFDERDIAFFREDEVDRAKALQTDMQAIDAGIRAGFDADAVVRTTMDRNLAQLLGKHTGLVSVQMMSPRQLEREEEQADITATIAQAAQALGFAGFDPESIAKALGDDGRIDLGKLKKAELPPAVGAGPGGAGGAPKPGGPGGGGVRQSTGNPAQGASTNPDKPKPKPKNGGGSGQQGSQ